MSDRIAKEDYAVAKSSIATFDQSSNSTTATVVPVIPSLGSITLITQVDAILTTIMAEVSTNRKLLNKIIDVLQAAGLAS